MQSRLSRGSDGWKFEGPTGFWRGGGEGVQLTEFQQLRMVTNHGMVKLPSLILIRHSIPETVQALPANQWHLSQAGRRRCKPLADRVADYAPDVIIASVEPKAAETAQILAKHLNLTYHIVEGLHEHERGNLEWVGKRQFEAQVGEFFKHPQALVMGKESANQAHERFARTISSLIERHPNSNIAVVAHGTVITLFVARVVGLEPLPLWKRLGLPSFVVFSLPGLELAAVVQSVAAESNYNESVRKPS